MANLSSLCGCAVVIKRRLRHQASLRRQKAARRLSISSLLSKRVGRRERRKPKGTWASSSFYVTEIRPWKNALFSRVPVSNRRESASGT